MAMSRKHYREFAEVLKTAQEEYPDNHDAIRAIAFALCGVFKRDNSNFDRQKFLEASLKSN